MSLPRIFTQLYGEAATTGRPALKRLEKGATIKVRVAGRRRQVILGRPDVPVGEAEIVTFRRDGRIPDEAERQDYTAKSWHYVALTWEEPPGLFDEEETAPITHPKTELPTQ